MDINAKTFSGMKPKGWYVFFLSAIGWFGGWALLGLGFGFFSFVKCLIPF